MHIAVELTDADSLEEASDCLRELDLPGIPMSHRLELLITKEENLDLVEDAVEMGFNCFAVTGDLAVRALERIDGNGERARLLA